MLHRSGRVSFSTPYAAPTCRLTETFPQHYFCCSGNLEKVRKGGSWVQLIDLWRSRLVGASGHGCLAVNVTQTEQVDHRRYSTPRNSTRPDSWGPSRNSMWRVRSAFDLREQVKGSDMPAYVGLVTVLIPLYVCGTRILSCGRLVEAGCR
jgi:hypothetical protein